MFKNGVLVVVFCAAAMCSVIAQRNIRDKVVATPYVGVHYGMNLTGGDMANRYGYNSHLGGIAGYKNAQNWIFAADGNFMFGNQIRIDGLLENLRDSQGDITNTSGGPAMILLFLRGFNINATVGKVIPVWSPNPNSGIMIHCGVGYSWHRLRIESQEDEVPQLENDYLKGYDRLTIGVNTSQFIGYNFMASQGVYNFYAGFYFQQGFTRNQRDVFWDLPDQPVSMGIRNEFLYGFKVGWLIPVYKRQPKEYYFD